MRAAFVTLPALTFALPALLIDPLLAAAVFVAFLSYGWSLTTPRPERGEEGQ